MVNEETKDMITFFTITLSAALYNTYGVFLPYYFSYVKHFNPEITVKDMISLILLHPAGFVLCSFVLPTLLAIFGFKNTLRLGFVLNSLNIVTMFCFSSFFAVIICNIMIGFYYKFITTMNSLYFTDKYKQLGGRYFGVANAGTVVTSFLWANIFAYYVNPDNEGMNEIYTKGDYFERYFRFEVASRFKGILIIHIAVTFGLSLILTFFFENLENYPSNFGLIKKAFTGDLSVIKKKTDETNNSLNQSYSIIKSTSNESSMSRELLEHINAKPDLEDTRTIQEKTWIAIRSLRFMLLFVTSIFRNANCLYVSDYSKVLGSIIVDNDILVTKIYSLGGIVSVLGMTGMAFLVETLGLANTYILSLGFGFILDILFMFVLRTHPHLFLVVLLVTRVFLNGNLQLTNITLFSIYPTDVALQLLKLFDNSLLIGMCFTLFVNYLLYKNEVFFYVFAVLAVFDGISLLISIFFLKPILSKEEDNK